MIISAPNRMIEMENLRPLKAELPAVWFRYLKRDERVQGPRATHVGVGRSALVGTVQLQSATQTETRNR